MPASKAQQKAVNKYVKANYDLFQIKMPKGRKDNVKGVAAAAGESLNQYIISAINQRMERDTAGTATTPTGLTPEAGAVSLPPDTLEAAQQAADAAGEALPDFIRRAVATQAERDGVSLRMGINPATGGKLEKEA